MSNVSKEERLQDAIGNIGDDLIVGAKKKNRIIKLSNKTKAAIAAVLVVVLVAVAVIYPQRYSLVYGQYVVVGAEYPDLQDETRREKEDRKNAYAGAVSGLEEFYRASISEFLTEADGENVAFSPVNTGIALGMLAEITAGDSRSQILSVLGVDDIDILRQKTNSIWKANYADGQSACVLANSLWLDNNEKYKKEALENLAEYYFASSFYGDIGTEAYSKALRAWLNEQSKGLLEELNKDLKLDDLTVIALASTIYFEDEWEQTFYKKNNTAGVFHGVTGDITCEYMNETEYGSYYDGEYFVAAGKALEAGGKMWFILPNWNKDVDDILEDEEALEFITKSKKRDKGELTGKTIETKIELSLPKFDISSEISMIDGLKNMGAVDVFDYEASDFSTLFDKDELYVGKMDHSIRIIVDEEGVKAAGQNVTEVMNMGTSDVKKVILNRPFIFVISSDVGAPLFVGVVNQPQ